MMFRLPTGRSSVWSNAHTRSPCLSCSPCKEATHHASCDCEPFHDAASRMLLHWHLAAQRTRKNIISGWLIPCCQKRSDRALTCWESEVHKTIALLQYAANDVHSLPALSLSPFLAACTMGTAAVKREQDTLPLLSRQPKDMIWQQTSRVTCSAKPGSSVTAGSRRGCSCSGVCSAISMAADDAAPRSPAVQEGCVSQRSHNGPFSITWVLRPNPQGCAPSSM